MSINNETWCLHNDLFSEIILIKVKSLKYNELKKLKNGYEA
jgi:hypothetical protein